MQSLKFSDPTEQRQIFQLAGRAAKQASGRVEWRESWLLYWQGEPVARDAEAYRALLDDAYEALFTQNRRAAAALLATGHAPVHALVGDRRSRGDNPHRELSSVMRMRARLRGR